jgi:hypothetical protein
MRLLLLVEQSGSGQANATHAQHVNTRLGVRCCCCCCCDVRCKSHADALSEVVPLVRVPRGKELERACAAEHLRCRGGRGSRGRIRAGRRQRKTVLRRGEVGRRKKHSLVVDGDQNRQRPRFRCKRRAETGAGTNRRACGAADVAARC